MNKANTIAAGLKAKGYNVVWAEETADQVALAIDFIGNKELPWVRAFHLDSAGCDVPTFVAEVEDWKKSVRKGLHLSMASPTVQAVVAHYGLEETYHALRERHV